MHEYATSGLYTVQLVASGPPGFDEETKSNFVQVTISDGDFEMQTPDEPLGSPWTPTRPLDAPADPTHIVLSAETAMNNLNFFMSS